jgi:thymidylate kinase
MRIAISGAQCMGKSTLIKDFLAEWTSYKTPEKTYRDILIESELPHSSSTTKKTQQAILDFQVKQLEATRKSDKIIIDRCPLDNLVYSMWAYHHGVGDIDFNFIKKCVPVVRDSFKHIDIIFYIPITRAVKTPDIEEDGMRDANPFMRVEIDNLFKVFAMENRDNPKSNYFNADDRPPIIETFGDRHERIQIMKLYLDADGDSMDPNGSLFNDPNLGMEDVEALEALARPELKQPDKTK